MRKLKLQVQVSLDGNMSDIDGDTSWMIWNWGPTWHWDKELQKRFIQLHSSIDCVLLSRKMAEEGFIHHWARVAENAGDPQSSFAKEIKRAQKVVFGRTLTKSLWENTTLAKGDLIEEVDWLKGQNGKDIIAYGGVSFANSLMETGQVDEYYLFVNPILLGSGLSPFEKLEKPIGLHLISSAAYECGLVVMQYGRS